VLFKLICLKESKFAFSDGGRQSMETADLVVIGSGQGGIPLEYDQNLIVDK
jgi:hypothetical protein